MKYGFIVNAELFFSVAYKVMSPFIGEREANKVRDLNEEDLLEFMTIENI